MEYTKDSSCPICGEETRIVIDLPRFPMTEMYEPIKAPFSDRGYVDQAFLYCEPCSHGKLHAIIDPRVLYGTGYRYRTGDSGSAVEAAKRFARFLFTFEADSMLSTAQTVIDIGGNDGTIVEKFVANKVIVDPHGMLEGGVVIPHLFHDADVSYYKDEQKIILCSHTLEHVADVNGFLAKIASIWRDGDLLAFSFPSLECLLDDQRIDQINHQHVQYFSLRSIGLLLAKHGFGILSHSYDHMHWGALMVLCDRKVRDVSAKVISGHRIDRIYTEFRAMLREMAVPKDAIAFGAALMLPVLRYHWPQLENVISIADNSKNKNGMRYINWEKPIYSDYKLAGQDVVITAVTSKYAARSLIAEAFAKGARNVIVPLKTL